MTKKDRRQEASGQDAGDAAVREGVRIGRVFCLALPVPPTANTYYRTRAYVPKDATNGEKPLAATYIASAGKKFREVVWLTARSGCREMCEAMPLTCRLSVDVVIHFSANWRCDIDNRLKPLLDALEHSGVIANDNQVDVLRVTRGAVRPRAGQCYVTIRELLPEVEQKELEL